MFRILKSIFSSSEPVNYSELCESGAKIIDVRTKGEFKSGHIKGSRNIPLQDLGNQLNKFRKDETLIVCCASGARSGSAKRMLEANGFSNVYNGGGWQRLQHQL